MPVNENWKILSAQLNDLKARVEAGSMARYDDGSMYTVSRVEHDEANDAWRVVSWEAEGVMDERFYSNHPDILVENGIKWAESVHFWYDSGCLAKTVRDWVTTDRSKRTPVKDMNNQPIPRCVIPGSEEDVLFKVLEVGNFQHVDSAYDNGLVANLDDIEDVLQTIAERWWNDVSNEELEEGVELRIPIRIRTVRASQFFGDPEAQ